MRTATSRKSIEQHYQWLEAEANREAQRQAEERRMLDALDPLVDLWGREKYLEWVDAFLTDSMTVDEIIKVAHSFYPECTCNPYNQPCAGCREWARARARLAGAIFEEER